MVRRLRAWIAQLLGATMFYTCLPIPSGWTLEFRGIARVAPIIGVLIGGLVGLLDWGFAQVGMPILTRSAIAVTLWIALTGGLHLDGAMDTADGLGVNDPQRRLQAMSDSATGAFGAIAAIVILLLKTMALSEIDRDRLWILMAVAGWGRWGQLVAIALYPYLKPTGKGAFHKESIRSLWEALPSFLLLFGLSGVFYEQPMKAIALVVGGAAIGILIGAWLDRTLGGQTGDTYGAIVEWTEALLLCLLTLF